MSRQDESPTLPTDAAELTSGLNIKYTKVPTINRQQFLQENRDKSYFRVYRTQVADPRERMPFAFPIGNYVSTNAELNLYNFDNDGGHSYIDDTDEIYMIGNLGNQRGGKQSLKKRSYKKRSYKKRKGGTQRNIKSLRLRRRSQRRH